MRTRLSALILCVLLVAGVTAQETRGTISGTVNDAQGVVPGATVRITNTDTNTTQELVTNNTGYFEAPLLQPGTYRTVILPSGASFGRFNAADPPRPGTLSALLPSMPSTSPSASASAQSGVAGSSGSSSGRPAAETGRPWVRVPRSAATRRRTSPRR